MVPKYFLFTCGDFAPLANCDNTKFRPMNVPMDHRGFLSFNIGPFGRGWFDLINTSVGVYLFSQRLMSVIEQGGVRGIVFYPAGISSVTSRALMQRQRPEYFWGRASGLIRFDREFEAHSGRIVPVEVVGSEHYEFFHLDFPRGLSGYVCTKRVLDVLRAGNIGSNVRILPLDYDGADPGFQIDVMGNEWPLKKYYPDGFVPHPNNLDQ